MTAEQKKIIRDYLQAIDFNRWESYTGISKLGFVKRLIGLVTDEHFMSYSRAFFPMCFGDEKRNSVNFMPSEYTAQFKLKY